MLNEGALELVRTGTWQVSTGHLINGSLSLSGYWTENHSFSSSSISISLSILLWRSALNLRRDYDWCYKGYPRSITSSSLSRVERRFFLFHREASKKEGKIETEKKSKIDWKTKQKIISGLCKHFSFDHVSEERSHLFFWLISFRVLLKSCVCCKSVFRLVLFLHASSIVGYCLVAEFVYGFVLH